MSQQPGFQPPTYRSPPPAYLTPAPPPVRPRRKVPVGLILGVIVGVAIIVTKPEIVVQTVTTPFALGVVIGIGVAFVLLGFLLQRIGLPALLRGALLTVVGLVLGYVLIWPFYRDDVIPTPLSAAAPPSPPPAAGASQEPAATPLTGTFTGLGGHDGTGNASLLETADGHVVRLEGVDIENGPLLNTYLVPGADQEEPTADAVLLGRFGRDGTRGDFNYPVPADTEIDPEGTYTVLVFCEPFQVPIAGATLS